MMDQKGTNQLSVSQEKVKESTEMVRKLIKEKKGNPKPENPIFTTMVPLIELEVYSENIEAHHSIEEFIFYTPLTEEEKKEAILSYPRNSSMITAHRQRTIHLHLW
ncbi:hypothetical protein AYI69_g9340 [Smittium culicis]|uniref:Uncharacterized protein n=1 Tax=Smittium culicis TaxID=133412 RepID=A0A1R1XDE8_9FUNG|nr:hypothetical protein AYI69_g9340 [Smittium culicis]